MRLVSTWQLHKHHLWLPFAPHQLHQTRQSTRTQTQTLLRCSLNSAAPLTLYTYTSCTQTFHGVNTQRPTLNTKWATHAATKPGITLYFEYQVQIMFPTTPLMALSVAHGTNVCHSIDETCPRWRDPCEACISGEVSKWSYHCSEPPAQMTLSTRKVVLFPDRTDVPSVESSDLKRGPGQFNWCVSCAESIRENSKLLEAFCGVLKEELWRQAFYLTVLFSTNIGSWYVNVNAQHLLQKNHKTRDIISGAASKLTLKPLAM